jgi:hypothetical protein
MDECTNKKLKTKTIKTLTNTKTSKQSFKKGKKKNLTRRSKVKA